MEPIECNECHEVYTDIRDIAWRISSYVVCKKCDKRIANGLELSTDEKNFLEDLDNQ